MPIHQNSNQFNRSNEHINWITNNFENVKTQQLKVNFKSHKIANMSLSYTGIDKYTYFSIKENNTIIFLYYLISFV